MSWAAVAAGLALGSAAAGLHLAAVALRASLALGGRPQFLLLGLPLALAAPGAAVIAAAAIGPRAAWAVPFGMVAARTLLLRRLGSRP